MRESVTYEEAVSYIERIPLFTKKTGPDNTRKLLGILEQPEEHGRIIHVAGTNGKGSTCAFLESVFRTMGLRTGLFTSPHMVRINERIRVCGEEIPDEGFLEMFRRVKRAASKLEEEGGCFPAYFEFLFAMAMCWFRESNVELLVCETGLGGRLDATNSIAKAEAEVITSISLDHTEYLGETVAEIAAEKAGIIRKTVPVIYCAEDPRSAQVIERFAREKNAERIPLKKDGFSITKRLPGRMQVKLFLPRGGTLDLEVPSEAEYQAQNACLAALCALRLGADEGSVQSGIRKMVWPARMEEIEKDVFLDGAHNPDGIRNIAAEIRRYAQKRKVWLLVSIVADKNYPQMVRELCRDVEYEGVLVTAVGGQRQLDVDDLAKEFLSAGQSRVETEADAGRAYRRALVEKGGGVLFCVGSLYLAGEVLAQEKERKHAKRKQAEQKQAE